MIFLLNEITVIFQWLQSSVSHDPSEIILICWFAAQETFIIIIIIYVENIEYFCGIIFFRILWWTESPEQLFITKPNSSEWYILSIIVIDESKKPNC